MGSVVSNRVAICRDIFKFVKDTLELAVLFVQYEADCAVSLWSLRVAGGDPSLTRFVDEQANLKEVLGRLSVKFSVIDQRQRPRDHIDFRAEA